MVLAIKVSRAFVLCIGGVRVGEERVLQALLGGRSLLRIHLQGTPEQNN